MEKHQFRSLSNQRILEQVRIRKEAYVANPLTIYPWLFKPCRVKVLLVTDGGLDFGVRDFGLSTFVSILQHDGRSYVRFDITVAHLSELVSDDAVMQGAAGIVRSIKGFRFDEPTHFTPDMYDQVWLFGIETNYHYFYYQHRNNNPNVYPADRLSDAELQNISAFMNKGGGLFATGDHGPLGRALCGSITRARSMRLWDSTSGDTEVDEVSMGGAKRNDTNRIGHDAGSQFDDQSDDIPQAIQPRLYHSRISPFFKETYPHPLLCSPDGRITVMPDHPHEGECFEPSDLTQIYPFDGTEEYPVGGGGVRIAPEVIATSSVPAGNNADSSKTATVAHDFGSICAYDGHAAGVGRVVTDATWHHFVNINLVGDVDYSDADIKGRGFLASLLGEAHFDQIKHYYVNIAVWISPAARHRCFHTRLIWKLTYQHRVLEAAVINPDIRLDRTPVHMLYSIGTHARDVLNRTATQCRRLRLILDLVAPIFPELVFRIDPWLPVPPRPEPPLPWIDPTPLLNLALGGAIVSLREQFPNPPEKIAEEVEQQAAELIVRGAKRALDVGLEAFQATLKDYNGLKLQ